MSRMYQTTDYRKAISAELEARQLLRRELAQALGRSESWLSLMFKGERPLDPELVEGVAGFLALDLEETAYLGALVDLENRSPRARRAAWATIHTIQRQRAATHLSEDIVTIYASWYTMAIGELARCEDFRPDPTWIAATLQPPITVEQAEEALTRLVRLGMLVPDERGGLRQSEVDGWSPTDLPPGPISEACARFHEDALRLAQQAVRGARHNERHVSGLVLAIPEGRYKAVVTALRELERHLVLEAEQDEAQPNRVYVLGMQIFPVSLYSDSEGALVDDHD
jgi:uncharacterized protein (TIGR02147 family)